MKSCGEDDGRARSSSSPIIVEALLGLNITKMACGSRHMWESPRISYESLTHSVWESLTHSLWESLTHIWQPMREHAMRDHAQPMREHTNLAAYERARIAYERARISGSLWKSTHSWQPHGVRIPYSTHTLFESLTHMLRTHILQPHRERASRISCSRAHVLYEIWVTYNTRSPDNFPGINLISNLQARACSRRRKGSL